MAPYVLSPIIGCFTAAMWTLIWCIRPVSSTTSRNDAPVHSFQETIPGSRRLAGSDHRLACSISRVASDWGVDNALIRIELT